MSIKPDFSLILAVLLAELLFGLLFNLVIASLERRGYLEGFTAFAVVIGVAGTLMGVAVLDPRAALLSLGAFAASGLPMVVGSWWRHVQARRHGQESLRQVHYDE
jgi:hypothetical protein